MAEQDTAQERTEDATPKRLADARKKADVPRSRELSTAVMLIIGMLALMLLGPIGAGTYRTFAHERWSIERADLFDPGAIPLAFTEAVWTVFFMLLPFLTVMVLAAFIATIMMGGWVFSAKPLTPDLSKLSPLKGLKKMFGPQGLMELLKALLKMVLMGFIAVFAFRMQIDDLLALAHMPLSQAVRYAFHIVFTVVFSLSLVVVLVAVIDVPWQKFQYAKKMRMTRQQIKEENKETMGNQEVKQKVRSLQQAVSQRKMLLDVPRSNVIIVNPTHFSIALLYDDSLEAPQVLAKGVDHMALRIREIARSSDVPIFSAPVLARALYRHTEIGQQIPTELYVAVAKVLAYVYQVQNASFGDELPQQPGFLEVPRALREPGPKDP